MKALTVVSMVLFALFMVSGSVDLKSADSDNLLTVSAASGYQMDSIKKIKAKKIKTNKMVLCGKCGEMKGTKKCCAKDAKVCKCGMHKGSPGCCKMEKGKDAKLCSKCGHVKGAKKCCAKDAKICKCGFHKGSPACCKVIKKK